MWLGTLVCVVLCICVSGWLELGVFSPLGFLFSPVVLFRGRLAVRQYNSFFFFICASNTAAGDAGVRWAAASRRGGNSMSSDWVYSTHSRNGGGVYGWPRAPERRAPPNVHIFIVYVRGDWVGFERGQRLRRAGGEALSVQGWCGTGASSPMTLTAHFPGRPWAPPW